jgi:polar amino acid transport system permease protein
VQYTWDFSFVLSNWRPLLTGAIGTFTLALACFAASGILGVAVGMALTGRAYIRIPATAFVGIFRNTPALIQLLWVFYALPILFNYQLTPFWAAFISFTCYSSAYLGSIVKSGIMAVPRSQREAAKSLALPFWLEMRLVVLPQAIPPLVPAFANQVIELIKLTSVASIIAYGELVLFTKAVSDQEYKPLESYTVLAIIFAAVLLPLSYVAYWLEHRFGSNKREMR